MVSVTLEVKCIINSALLTDIDYQMVGNVQLKPFCGKSISADVIRVNVAKGDDDDDDDGVCIYCAVVADLHDEMILAENAISRLLQTKLEANREFGDIQNNQADDDLCQNPNNSDCKFDSSADSQSSSHLCNAVVMSDESDVVPSVEL